MPSGSPRSRSQSSSTAAVATTRAIRWADCSANRYSVGSPATRMSTTPNGSPATPPCGRSSAVRVSIVRQLRAADGRPRDRVAGDRRQPGGAHGSVGRLDRLRARTQAARQHHPRHGQFREPDPRRAGRLGLERSLRLHLLPPAVRFQSVRRSGAQPAPARQRPQCRGLAPGAGAGDRPLPRAGRRSLLPRRCGVRQAEDLRAARGRGHPLRDPATGQPGVAAASCPPADAAGRPPKKPIVSYASFHYQAAGWTRARRVVAKVQWHQGELYPRVGFIVYL
jgi:hypothetical protein